MKLVHDAFPATEETNVRAIFENYHDFGVVDAKGRKVGVIVWGRESDHIPAREGHGHYTIFPLGRLFTIRSNSTRDGKIFGGATAMVADQDFDVAVKEINACIDRARKVAVRKFGKV